MYRPWVEVSWRDKRDKNGEEMILCGESVCEREHDECSLPYLLWKKE
jgi:hypothetical protein